MTSYTDKQKICKTILAKEMTPKQVTEKWKIPHATAKRWVLYLKKHAGELPRDRGRPQLVGTSVRSALLEEVKKKAENDEAVKLLSSDNKDAEILTLVRKLQKEKCPTLTTVVSARYVKDMLPQCNIIAASAQIKNQKRFAAEHDVLNALSMCALSDWVRAHIPNKALVVNMDATTFAHETITSNQKLRVAMPKEMKKQYQKQKKPVNTFGNLSSGSDTGVFAKAHVLFSYGGFYGPHVFGLAHKSLQAGQQNTYRVVGLGSRADDVGYVHVAMNRHSSEDFYRWYFTDIVIPFLQRIRRDVNDFQSPALLLFDGEAAQCSSALCPETRKALLEAKIIIAKRAPNTTAITQELDVSKVFSSAHRFAASTDAGTVIQAREQVKENVEKALEQFYAERKFKKEHKRKWINVLLRASYGLGEASRVSMAVKAFQKVGIITQHEPDYARIMANFHIKHADTTQIKACLPTLVAELHKFGSISDECLHKQPFVQAFVRLGLIPEYKPDREPTRLALRSWRLAMLLHGEVQAAHLRKQSALLRATARQGDMISEADQVHANKRRRVSDPLQAAAQEATALKVAAKALRVERKRLALEKQQNRMLREAGRLTNSKRKRDEAE